MGLSSLPILNKLGYNNYWNSFFYSNKFYTELLSTILTLELIILILSNERFFFNFYNKIYSKKQYKIFMLDHKDVDFKNKKLKTFVGEFWFFNYSNYFLISTLIFNSNLINEKSIKLRLNYDLFSLFYLDFWTFF